MYSVSQFAQITATTWTKLEKLIFIYFTAAFMPVQEALKYDGTMCV